MENSQKKIRVVVGLSGGVDSSVAAALLVQQGYELIGVYMKNWSTDSPTLGARPLPKDSYRMACPWYEDYLDAKRVALTLGIPLLMWDFREAYKKKVFDYIVDEFAKGRTPNPDIYCNNLVKFDDFLKKAVKGLKADFVATGHYASVISTKANGRMEKSKDLKISRQARDDINQDEYQLQIPKDTKKDQTYFLYRLNQDQLSKVLFPLANYTKEAVRTLAKKYNLPTKYKKDSQGLCFIGDVELQSFLTHWLAPKPGKILEEQNRTIGEHKGVHLYTIGQKIAVNNRLIAKHYPNIKKTIPEFYVASKNVKDNTLVAVPGADNEALYKSQIVLEDVIWQNKELRIMNNDKKNRNSLFVIHNSNMFARVRHTGTLEPVSNIKVLSNKVKISFKNPVSALAPGQHVVLYDKTGLVLGGGVIS